jgi:hypothetical protein
VKQLSALHSEHSLAKKGLQKRRDFWREREKKRLRTCIARKRSPKQLTNIQTITARDEAQQIQEQGTIRKRK